VASRSSVSYDEAERRRLPFLQQRRARLHDVGPPVDFHLPVQVFYGDMLVAIADIQVDDRIGASVAFASVGFAFGREEGAVSPSGNKTEEMAGSGGGAREKCEVLRLSVFSSLEAVAKAANVCIACKRILNVVEAWGRGQIWLMMGW